MMELISGGKKDSLSMEDKYLDLFAALSSELSKDPDNKQTVKKAVFYGVKYMSLSNYDQSEYDMLLARFQLSDIIKSLISRLTPNDLMQIFPVSKTYNGNRCGIKDYFYTISAMRKYGMDKPIGESVEDVLWDYVNPWIVGFGVKVFGIVSALMKANGEPGILESFAAENGITTHTMHTDERGKRYFVDGKTGKAQPVKRRIPRYMKVIK